MALATETAAPNAAPYTSGLLAQSLADRRAVASDSGVELARTTTDDGTAVVITSGDRTTGNLATVGGRAFVDLPALLAAAAGDPRRIESGADVLLADARLLPVVARPRKVVCIGLNYRAHAVETGAPIPDRPVVFPKWDNGSPGLTTTSRCRPSRTRSTGRPSSPS